MSSSVTAKLLYIQSDVPDGMTLSDWRRRDAAPQSPRTVGGITRWARSLVLG
jgi:uncharacterized protein Usg